MLQEIYSEQSRVRNIGIDVVRQLSCIFMRLSSAHAQQHVHRFEKRGLVGLYAAIGCDAVE
jgi:hypothetical protein